MLDFLGRLLLWLMAISVVGKVEVGPAPPPSADSPSSNSSQAAPSTLPHILCALSSSSSVSDSI